MNDLRQEEEDRMKVLLDIARLLSDDFPQAVTQIEAVQQLLYRAKNDVHLEANLKHLMRKYDCVIEHAAFLYFQRLYENAIAFTVNGKEKCSIGGCSVFENIYEPGYECEFYIRKYGRLPETHEEVVNWWLEYDADGTVPVSGGVRHTITPRQQFDQLVAIGSYPYATVTRAHRLIGEKPEEAMALSR